MEHLSGSAIQVVLSLREGEILVAILESFNLQKLRFIFSFIYFQIPLTFSPGKGFHRISNPTTIVATLNGQALETGSIEPDSQPSYNTDLVWKADKNVLRKYDDQRVVVGFY